MGRLRKAAERARAADVRDLVREARFAARFVAKYRRRLLLLFAGLALPLWGFAELAEDVHEGEGFGFDEPLLRFAHAIAGPGLDRFQLLLSDLGYAWFVVPFDLLLVAVLAWRRRVREGLFAAVARRCSTSPRSMRSVGCARTCGSRSRRKRPSVSRAGTPWGR